jgi:hypothetical protein
MTIRGCSPCWSSGDEFGYTRKSDDEEKLTEILLSKLNLKTAKAWRMKRHFAMPISD